MASIFVHADKVLSDWMRRNKVIVSICCQAQTLKGTYTRLINGALKLTEREEDITICCSCCKPCETMMKEEDKYVSTRFNGIKIPKFYKRVQI
jgi:hypothetical protein